MMSYGIIHIQRILLTTDLNCSNKYLVCRHNTLTSFQAAWLKTYKTYKNYKTFKSSFLKVMKHQNTVQDFRFSTEICTVLPHDVIWHH